MLTITQEYLDDQFPKDVPKDWETNLAYSPQSRMIMGAWVKFTKTLLGKELKEGGTTLRLVPPALYWGFDHVGRTASVLLNYMPTALTNVVKVGEHPATARRSDGSLQSNTWAVVEQSAGRRAYELTAKANFHPFAFSYMVSQLKCSQRRISRLLWRTTKHFL